MTMMKTMVLRLVCAGAAALLSGCLATTPSIGGNSGAATTGAAAGGSAERALQPGALHRIAGHAAHRGEHQCRLVCDLQQPLPHRLISSFANIPRFCGYFASYLYSFFRVCL